MAIEKLAYVDKNGALLGVASREDIHSRGLWHETFHCWIVGRELGKDMVHLQLRSRDKADFPNLFDITAAGHIASHETVADGVREIDEELGLSVGFKELAPLGVIFDEIRLPEFTDRERAHNFLYKADAIQWADYRLQTEEVAGIAAVDFQSFYELCTRRVETIEVKGFHETSEGRKAFSQKIGLGNMVPHEESYWEQVVLRIRQSLMR